MNSLVRNLRTIVNDRPDLLFYGAFLLALPFTWRKVFFVFEPLRQSGFNEYTDISLFIVDILLIITLVLYIKEHTNSIMSIFKQMFHVEHMVIGISLLLIALISTFLSEQKLLAFYSLGHFFLALALFVYIVLQFVPRGTNEKSSTWNFIKYTLSIIVISAILQSIIAFVQFIIQSSIGLKFLGESKIETSIDGVAEIIIGSEAILRSYGTFLHPNILGGFLFIAILSLIFLKNEKLFHVEQWIFILILTLLSTSILFSFSKSGILALILALFYYCSTWNIFNRENKYQNKNNRVFHVEHFYLPAVIGFFLIFILIAQNQEFRFQSIKERAVFYPIALNMIIEKPFFGLGPGHFVYKLPEYAKITENWQLQPVHNTYVLIIIENGLIFSLVFFAFIVLILINVPRGTNYGRFVFSLTMGLLFIGLFDHYLWDIVFGQYLFGIVLAFASGSVYLKD